MDDDAPLANAALNLSPDGETPAIPDHVLLRRIGRGSYGEVWLGRNHAGTPRAVKIIRRAKFDDDRPYEREFTGLKNFEPLSREHEGLVDILQLGRNDAECWFYSIMELADDAPSQSEDGSSKMEDGGQPRNAVHHPPPSNPAPETYRPLTLEYRIRTEGRLPVEECLRIAATLADALVFLHERGFVHRDIKPSNIIFVGGVPKLADVGLVALAESAATFVGTEGFIPPEGPGTPQADLYSLGKCLYEMAMGKDRQAFPSPPTLLDELPDRAELLEFNEVITKACAPQPGQRYHTAAALAADLRVLATGHSLQRTRRQARLRRASLVVGALGLVCGLVWLGLPLIRGPRLALVREFSLPGGASATSAKLGDLYGDGETELVVVAEKGRVLCLSREGDVLNEMRLRDAPEAAWCDSLASFGSTKALEPIISTVTGTNVSIRILTERLLERWRTETNGPIYHASNNVEMLDTHFIPLGVLPGHGGESPQLLTALTTGFSNGGRTRELRAYNGTNREPSWVFPVANAPWSFSVGALDLDGDGVEDWLAGTYAGNNGHQLSSGEKDAHSYLLALTRQGQLLWSLQTGDEYTCAFPRSFPVRGSNALFCLVFRDAPRTVMDTNTSGSFAVVLRLTPAGKELARADFKLGLTELRAFDVEGKGMPQLLAPDDAGCLQVLDPDSLRCIRVVPVAPRTNDWVESWLGPPADLDGDGRPEVVMLTTQVKFIQGRDVTSIKEENRRRYAATTLHVLGANLAPLASLELRSESKLREEFRVHICDPSPDGTREIVVLGPTVRFYRLTTSRWH